MMRVLALAIAVLFTAPLPSDPSRDQILATMKRATRFMVEKVATRGGYVWTYLPDLSRRWGEMEARDTMIWVQPPGTATMGHLFLDAYHATRDEYYYQAAEQVANALIWGQHPSGGWNYIVDFAGERSLREWYDTVGKNGWRLEEFQHYWGNATFDDAGTIDSAKLLLRLYVEKRDPRYKPALDKAMQFVLDSQYPIGAWPQRYPRADGGSLHGMPDYTSYLTFNDDVAAENIDFLLMCYQALGDPRVLDSINRAMNAFLVTQQGPPQPGWALQYTPDLQPSAARSYEPKALATHTTATNIGLLIRFYRLTGDTKFLARIPDALDWLEGLRLPPGVAPQGRTHPTFIELGTNKPIYVHREGSNVVNGRYYFDSNPKNTIGHYSSFRPIDVAALRTQYEAAKAMTPEQATKDSPLKTGTGDLPRYVAVAAPRNGPAASAVIAALNADGYWPTKLVMNSHPYKGDGPATPSAGNYATTHVGDESDTSPYPDDTLVGISLEGFIHNMSALITALPQQPSTTTSSQPVVWTIDNLERIGGHAVERIGSPRVVQTPIGAAVEFNGVSDGLLVDNNPLEGLSRFTLEAIFEPAADGSLEQRFVHMQEHATENRALLELRLLPNKTWYLDTFLRYNDAQLALIDKAATHPAASWHVASLTYDGQTQTHYVDGVKEMSGSVSITPLAAGKTSLGVRQNRVSWFKGRIRQIRITPEVLTADRLLKKPVL